MAKLITVPKKYGNPYFKVWLNGEEYIVYTGKEISVGDALYDLLIRMMDKNEAYADTNAENFRVKFTLNGDKVVCNRSHADVFVKAIGGANVIAEYEEDGNLYIMKSAYVMKSNSQITFSCTTATSSGIKHLIIHYYNTGNCSKAVYSVSG